VRTHGNVVLEERPVGDTSSKATDVTSMECKIDNLDHKDNANGYSYFLC
jgi:hypothetical protein